MYVEANCPLWPMHCPQHKLLCLKGIICMKKKDFLATSLIKRWQSGLTLILRDHTFKYLIDKGIDSTDAISRMWNAWWLSTNLVHERAKVCHKYYENWNCNQFLRRKGSQPFSNWGWARKIRYIHQWKTSWPPFSLLPCCFALGQ